MKVRERQVSTTDHRHPERSATRGTTMAHIAERAGVALSTVSYVFSGKRGVSPAIRERVLAAVEELNYRPHRSARALASGASHTIALFLPSPQWELIPVQQTFVAGATQETSASDYALLLSTSPADPDGIAGLIETGRADGVILMETLAHDRRIERLKTSGQPFTLIGRTADTSGISFVDLDFGAAVEKSLAHLHDLGHRCVALFNFPQDQLDAGYNAALIARDEGVRPQLGAVLDWAVLALVRTGRPDVAVVFLGILTHGALSDVSNYLLTGDYARDQALERLRSVIGDDTEVDALVARGAAMSYDEMVTYALEQLAPVPA